MPEITRRLDRAELGKRIERAEKLLQKGKTAEALEEYLAVLKDDPENDVVRQLRRICVSLWRATRRPYGCSESYSNGR